MASSKRPNASGVNEFFESDANELGCETRRGKRRRTLGTTSLGVDEGTTVQISCSHSCYARVDLVVMYEV